MWLIPYLMQLVKYQMIQNGVFSIDIIFGYFTIYIDKYLIVLVEVFWHHWLTTDVIVINHIALVIQTTLMIP